MTTPPRKPTLADQAALLDGIGDTDVLWQRVQRTMRDEGIEFLIYITVDAMFAAPHVLTNMPDLYAGTAPSADPFLHHCCRSYAITPTGPAYVSDYDYLPDRDRRFIEGASATGFRTGLGIPMRLNGSARFGGFNLGTRLDRPAFEAQIVPRREEFRVYCLLAHRRIEELSRAEGILTDHGAQGAMIAPESTALAALTPREREIAYLVAQGLTRKECARLCALSPHTVSEYLKAVYAKLQINDRMQLARIVNASQNQPFAQP